MGSLLWTGPRRVGMLFYSLGQYARRVAGHRTSSVIPQMNADIATDESWPKGDAFAAVLRGIEELWRREACSRVDDRVLRFFLIEQWSERRDEAVGGEVVAAWIVDRTRLFRINAAEHAAHRRYLRENRPAVFPFNLVSFWISDDGFAINFGFRWSSRGGSGGDYIVGRDDSGPLIVSDPNGGFWVS